MHGSKPGSKPPVYSDAKKLADLRDLTEIMSPKVMEMMNKDDGFMHDCATYIKRVTALATEFKLPCDAPRHFKTGTNVEKNVLEMQLLFAEQALLEANAVPDGSEDLFRKTSEEVEAQRLIIDQRYKEYEDLKQRLASLNSTINTLVDEAAKSLKKPVEESDSDDEDHPAPPTATGRPGPAPFLAGIAAAKGSAAGGARPAAPFLGGIAAAAAAKGAGAKPAPAAAPAPAAKGPAFLGGIAAAAAARSAKPAAPATTSTAAPAASAGTTAPAPAAGVKLDIATRNKIKAFVIDYEANEALRIRINKQFKKIDTDSNLYTNELQILLNDPNQRAAIFAAADKFSDEVAEARRIKAQIDREKHEAEEKLKKIASILARFNSIGVTLQKPADAEALEDAFGHMMGDLKAYKAVGEKIITALSATMKQLRAEIKTAEGILTGVQARSAGLATAPGAAAVDTAKLKTENAKLRAELDAKAKTLADITALQVQNEQMQLQIAEHSAKNQHLKDEIERLRTMLAAADPAQAAKLKAELDTLQADLAAEEAILKAMKDANLKINAGLKAAAIGAAPDQAATIQALTDRIAEQEEQIARLLADAGTTRTGIATLSAQQQKQQADIDAAIKAATDLLSALNATADRLRTITILDFQQRSGAGAVETARAEREAKKGEIATAIQSVQGAIDRIGHFQATANHGLISRALQDALRSSVATASSQAAGAQTTIDQLNADIARLSRRR